MLNRLLIKQIFIIKLHLELFGLPQESSQRDPVRLYV